jgi:hypothetical protein
MFWTSVIDHTGSHRRAYQRKELFAELNMMFRELASI